MIREARRQLPLRVAAITPAVGFSRSELQGPLLDVAKLFAQHPVPVQPSHTTDLSNPANTSAARDPPRALSVERGRRKVHIEYRNNTHFFDA